MEQHVMSKSNNSSEFMTRHEAAEYIHRHASTLDKWRAQRICLPFYKDGKKVLYSISDLDAYLASKRVEPIAYGIDQ
jgi:excisionase family DNA binding protein